MASPTSSRSRMPACARLIALFAYWEQPFECADPWLPAVGYEPLADLFKLTHVFPSLIRDSDSQTEGVKPRESPEPASKPAHRG